MNTKLTLTLDKEVIERGKLYAKNTGRSLSEMIEAYLIALTKVEESKAELSPFLKSIVGSVPLPDDFDEEKELREYFEKKHL